MLTLESGLKEFNCAAPDSRFMLIFFTSITSSGRSNTHDSAESVCDITVRRTILSAPAKVFTAGGVNVRLISMGKFSVINPVEPEVAPGWLESESKPADHPVGASKNKS